MLFDGFCWFCCSSSLSVSEETPDTSTGNEVTPMTAMIEQLLTLSKLIEMIMMQSINLQAASSNPITTESTGS